MHTLTRYYEDSATERTERFAGWYDRFVEFEGEPTTITVHEVWQAYGGPEEGGWWYSCGAPIKTICIFSRSQAIRLLHELHEEYNSEEFDEQTYDISLSQGYAQWYPETRPHYE